MRRMTYILAALFAVLAIAGCGNADSGSGRHSQPVVLSAANLPELGEVLVDEGVTLYVFAPDRATAVTCAGACAVAWPPLTVPPGEKPSASGTVRQSLLGTASGPGGGEVATYAGWPLYSFVSDTEPGETNGQNVNLNGGYWYLISPSGKVIR